MTAAQIAERVQARRNGHGWMAKCLVHADHTPSVSISEGAAGRVLVKCFAGCPTEAVVAAWGLSMADLFPEPKGEPCVVAEYEYRDEKGVLLYVVERLDPKGFRQRRPDGKGGWVWHLDCETSEKCKCNPKLAPVRRVLYRLPEVLKAKSVLIVEGEKDAEMARNKLGFAATCNPGGAGKWRPEYSESLRGKRTALIADVDVAGRSHVQDAASSLYGKAESLKVLELPGAKDLTEWFEHGGTRAALLALIRNATEWKPTGKSCTTEAKERKCTTTETQKSGFSLTTLGDLLNEPEEAVAWLVEDKLPAGGISVLSAKPKVGKSTLARCLALAVAGGDAFLGCQTTKGTVIYLALEEKRSEVRHHFTDLGATGKEPIHIHCAAAPKDAMSELCKIVEELKPALVIIDPLFKFVRVADEKAYVETCRAIEPLLILARASGAHVLLVHHNGKAERADAMDAILGSTAIFGGVDSALILKRTDRYRTLQSSQKSGTDWPETVLEFDTVSRSLALGSERSEADAKIIADAILEYLASASEPKTESEIFSDEAVKGKTGPKRKALRALVEEGKAGRAGTGKKGDPYKYSFPCSPYMLGTRKQESQNEAETRINTSEMLVPESKQKTILVPDKIEGDL